MKLSSPVEQALTHVEETYKLSARLAAGSLAAKMAVVQGVRTFPDVARRAMSMLNDMDYKIPELTRIIKEDPSLTAGVMRLANSAFFSRGKSADSIDKAVIRLGRSSVKEVICSVATMELFADVSGFGKEVRDHCVAVAAISQEMMRDLVPSLIDGSYLIGLMHDVGKLLLLASGEIFYDRVERNVLRKPDTIHHLERTELGYDHAILGGQVLWHWTFPEPVPQAVAWHHEPALAYKDQRVDYLTAVLRIADQLEPNLLTGEMRREEFVDSLIEKDDCQFAGIGENYLLEKWEDLEEAKRTSHELFG